MNTKDFKTRSETIHRAAPCPQTIGSSVWISDILQSKE